MRRRLLAISPDHEPLWGRLYVQPYASQWAARLVGDEIPSLDPDEVTGLTFVGATSEEAERLVKVYLGMSAPAN